LLEISINSLKKFGANNGELVHSGQVYRLLSAIFVHTSFGHFIGNIFSTFILITRIEHTFGPFQTLCLYLICGIGGNIFSLTVDTDSFSNVYKAGASTALYGSIGIILGYLVINWVGLQPVGDQMRCNIVCVFMFLLIFVMIFTPSSENVDFYGHLGGFLTGIWATGFVDSLIF
jgi:rhomboid protease GluP